MRKDIKKFVKECYVCQVNKHETIHPTGLLQPLHIPTRLWFDISMDFIEALPLSQGSTVDNFTKYEHFIPVSHPYSASEVA